MTGNTEGRPEGRKKILRAGLLAGLLAIIACELPMLLALIGLGGLGGLSGTLIDFTSPNVTQMVWIALAAVVGVSTIAFALYRLRSRRKGLPP